MELKRINEDCDDYEYLTEMAEVRRLKLGNTWYKFLVYGDEVDNVPHFHLYPIGGSNHDEICIKLDKPEYFIHGIYTNMLDSKERRDLRRELKTEDQDGVTLWNLMRLNWNGMHPEGYVKNEMPDYSELPDKK